MAAGQGRFRDETLMELCVIGLTSKKQSGQPTGGIKKVSVILALASQCVGNSEELLMTWVAR